MTRRSGAGRWGKRSERLIAAFAALVLGSAFAHSGAAQAGGSRDAGASSRPEAAARPGKLKPSAPGTASLTIVITGFESDQGQALVSVYRSADGFPDQGRRASWSQALRIQRRAVRVTIEGLRPGPAAVAMAHDENKNFKVDTGLFGIPTEGYGASRDAPARFGPPEFGDAVFELKPGEHKQITFRVRY